MNTRRGKSLINLLKVIDLLAKPEGTTINEIREHIGVDRRSVYRTIHLIEELGFPIYDDQIDMDRQKRWKLDESYRKKLPNITLPDLKLTLSEIISLYLLKGQAGLFKGTELEKPIRSSFEKLGLFMPQNAFTQLEKIKALFLTSNKFAKDYSGKEKIIEQLTQAMLQNKTSIIKYHSFSDDQVKGFKIDPLHFFEHDGGLYLFVRATRFGEIRTLAVERIQEIVITSAFFEYPTDFDPQDNLDSAFDIVSGDPIQVKIWFSADQARYIKERKWAKTQKIKDQKDGSIILFMDTSGRWDVKRWVLSFGGEAKVLQPNELQKEITAELVSSLHLYRK